MSDLLVVGTILAFFLVVWACNHITTDAAADAGSETESSPGNPERT